MKKEELLKEKNLTKKISDYSSSPMTKSTSELDVPQGNSFVQPTSFKDGMEDVENNEIGNVFFFLLHV